MVLVRTLFAVLGALIAGVLAHIWLHPSPRLEMTLVLTVYVIGVASSTAASRRSRQRRLD